MAESRVNTGIADSDRAAVAQALSRFLADTYTTYLKTQFFHWNVTGPQFNALHKMFEEQYTDLAEKVDEAAERIRALGHNAPGTFADFSRLKSIDEQQGVPSAREMVNRLLESREAVIKTGRDVVKKAEAAGDDGTLDLLGTTIREHEKTAWMLRALLEGWADAEGNARKA